MWRERGAPWPSLATSTLADHCDRSAVTVASRGPLEAQGPFCRPVVSCAARTRPVRPETGTPHRHLDSAAPALPTLFAKSCPPTALPVARRWPKLRERNRHVTYADRTLTCVDCGVEFIHSAADQEYYAQKGFASDPKRCASCRASRRASRDAGYDVRDIGGPRGYERGDDRVAREYFAVICSSCGNQAQVPFKPRMDRPVYCSDCFRKAHPD